MKITFEKLLPNQHVSKSGDISDLNYAIKMFPQILKDVKEGRPTAVNPKWFKDIFCWLKELRDIYESSEMYCYLDDFETLIEKWGE